MNLRVDSVLYFTFGIIIGWFLYDLSHSPVQNANSILATPEPPSVSVNELRHRPSLDHSTINESISIPLDTVSSLKIFPFNMRARDEHDMLAADLILLLSITSEERGRIVKELFQLACTGWRDILMSYTRSDFNGSKISLRLNKDVNFSDVRNQRFIEIGEIFRDTLGNVRGDVVVRLLDRTGGWVNIIPIPLLNDEILIFLGEQIEIKRLEETLYIGAPEQLPWHLRALVRSL